MKKALFFVLLFVLFFLSACNKGDESGVVRIVVKDAEEAVLFDEEIGFTEKDTLVSLMENHEEINMKGETSSQFGYFVTELCGLKAENAYWAILVDGEYSMVGISSIPLKDKAVIEFVLTPIEQ